MHFLNKKQETYLALFLLLSMFLLFLFLFVFTESTYDSGDGIRHYFVSRYCWYHPELLLYSWGKPFFTLISSPFSQFGLAGITVFNILCGLGSAWFAYRTAKLLKLDYAPLVILFLFFTPVYFPTINSGLTEPFFGLVLITVVYLYFKEKYFWATVLISFLPFVRTEGNLLLPLFFLVLLYRRKYFFIPFLAFGSLLYSFIGWLYYKDWLWLISQNPYTGSNRDFYGHGPFMYFINGNYYIWGNALTILLVVGILVLFFKGFVFLKNKNDEKNQFYIEELFLVFGTAAVYFFAHTLMWWKGWANSLGLIRVLAGIVPCAALVFLRGLNVLMLPFIKKIRAVEITILVLLLFWVVKNPFEQHYYPFKLGKEEAVLKKAADWYKQSAFTNKQMYYIYPIFAHFIDIDPFDSEKYKELWGLYPTIREYGFDVIPDSTVIFWDAHFGPNECQIPLDTILNDTRFENIAEFKPDTPFTTLGGYPFEVYVFMKLSEPRATGSLGTDMYDLESVAPELTNMETRTDVSAFSGKQACALSSKAEYSVLVSKAVAQIPASTSKIELKCKLNDKSNNAAEALFVISVEDRAGKNLYWESALLTQKNPTANPDWNEVKADFLIFPGHFPADAIVKMYIWNKEKKDFLIDDFEINYYGFK